MKKFMRSVSGVTLLEIMLVLAIAAMIIVMSVRYYQSAQSSSQANSYTQQAQAIQAAAENLAAGTGWAAGLPISTALPATWNQLPWGGTLTVVTSATGFVITNGTAPNTQVCALIIAKLVVPGGKWAVPAGCATATYTAST
jgi:type II secretory pathway pseudopilin PulG